jgi:hypothetical protein
MAGEQVIKLGREVTLPSGAVLKIDAAGFKEARNLFQAVMRSIGQNSISLSNNKADAFRKIMAITLSSEEVDFAIWQCMKKCLYFDGTVDKHITPALFETPETREDYTKICIEIEVENVFPFLKGLLSGLENESAKATEPTQK